MKAETNGHTILDLGNIFSSFEKKMPKLFEKKPHNINIFSFFEKKAILSKIGNSISKVMCPLISHSI